MFSNNDTEIAPSFFIHQTPHSAFNLNCLICSHDLDGSHWPIAVFHWAWKLVITTSAVGFSVPRKPEAVNTTRKLVHFQPHRVSDF